MKGFRVKIILSGSHPEISREVILPEKINFRELTENTLKTCGPILFITAAGGVLGKVIAASGTEVEYFLFDVKSACIVDEVVQSTVAAREDYDAIVVTGDEKVIVAAHRSDVNVANLSVG